MIEIEDLFINNNMQYHVFLNIKCYKSEIRAFIRLNSLDFNQTPIYKPSTGVLPEFFFRRFWDIA